MNKFNDVWYLTLILCAYLPLAISNTYSLPFFTVDFHLNKQHLFSAVTCYVSF
jgi:hypothetical protein